MKTLEGINSLQALVDKLGYIGVFVEQNLYNIAKHHSEDYNGGHWKSKQFVDDENITIDGFYLDLDDNKEYRIRNSQNLMTTVKVNSLTYSLTIFCHATNILGNYLYEDYEDYSYILFELSEEIKIHAHKLLDEDSLNIFNRFID